MHVDLDAHSTNPTDVLESIWAQLAVLCSEGRVPHLLFHGPSHDEKKTLIDRLLHRVYHIPGRSEQLHQRCTLWTNCAHRKGIRFVREELKFFAQTNLPPGAPFKTVVLYNLDSLTIDAQSALRRCMEKYSNTTRFVGTVVHPRRLLSPILSRFCDIYVPTARFPIPSVSGLDEETQGEISALVFRALNTDADGGEDHPIRDWLPSVSQLYEKAVTCRDLLNTLPAELRTEVAMAYHEEHANIRNEKLMMLRLLFLVRQAAAAQNQKTPDEGIEPSTTSSKGWRSTN